MENIGVFVRIRPLSENEKIIGTKCLDHLTENSLKMLGNSNKVFTFDSVFGEDSTQVNLKNKIMFPTQIKKKK